MSTWENNTDRLKAYLTALVVSFVAENQGARVVSQGLKCVGVGILPVIDHLCFFTNDFKECLEHYRDFGYEESFSSDLEITEGIGHVLIKKGYPALIVIEAGESAFIKSWLEKFNHRQPFFIAVEVEHIENAVFYMEKQGVAFTEGVFGKRGDHCRLAFSAFEVKEGQLFSTLRLVERLRGYQGFMSCLPSQKTLSAAASDS